VTTTGDGRSRGVELDRVAAATTTTGTTTLPARRAFEAIAARAWK
jgi:hypothetical protein